jgi:hypothetical protein
VHTIIRRYHVDDGDLNELMHRVDTAFADLLAAEPGFVAYEAVSTGLDTLMTISTFSDADGCERSNRLAARFVRDDLSDMTLSRLDTQMGDVAVSRAAQEVLEPSHA